MIIIRFSSLTIFKEVLFKSSRKWNLCLLLMLIPVGINSFFYLAIVQVNAVGWTYYVKKSTEKKIIIDILIEFYKFSKLECRT
jgi:hypothetical protein